MEQNNKNFRQIFSDEGYCFANKDEDMIFYNSVWADDESIKTYHQITLERAKEIVDEYKKKYSRK